jgi:hypothetical protein
MGKARLNVEFENGHIGKFIDWQDGELLERPQPMRARTPVPVPTQAPTTSSPQNPPPNDDVSDLTMLLQHMAFKSAIVISSEYENSQRMDQLLVLFERAVRNNVLTLSTNNRQHSEQDDATSPRVSP